MTADIEAKPAERDGFLAIALRSPVLTALAIFISSRVIVFAGIALADYVVAARTGEGLWRSGEAWYHQLLRWDAYWYQGIASGGYVVSGASNAEASIVFFPLLPLLARALADLTGLRLFDAMLLVTNVAGVSAICMLATLVRPLYGSAAAIRSAALMSVLPTSVFLSSAYTEPLALALVLAAFIALQRERFWQAALASGLATGARSASVAIVPVIMAQAVLGSSLPPVKRAGMVAALVVLASGGLLAFMGWQGWTFGDPFAFAKGQQAWSGDTGMFVRLFRAATLNPLFPFSYGAAWFIAFTVLTVAGARRLPWTWTLYGALALAIPYVSLGTGAAKLTSMPRFALMAFPAIVALALMLEGRPRLTLIVLTVGAVGLFLTTAYFSQWHWAG